jgi:hypothetical protein
MLAFVIRPFGKKKGIDFERVHAELIDPALNTLKISGRTTGEILEAGNIRTDMFQRLLIADIVIADITTNNANAFYELGIRHALRDRRTFLLRGNVPAVEGHEKDEVPFDLRTDRYLSYDPENPGATLDALIEGLRQTLASDRQDSPVFLSLPNLRVQDRSRLTPVPADFAEEVARALEEKRLGKLALLAMEVSGFPWETEGLRMVGKAQVNAIDLRGAKYTWEMLLKLDENNIEANLWLGTVYQRLGDLTRSNQCLERVTRLSSATPADLAETYALLGRNRKQLWQNVWLGRPAEEQPKQALASPLLITAYEEYRNAFYQDLNACYPAINALGLLIIAVELAKKYPDIWKKRFADKTKAQPKLDELQLQRDELSAAVAYCIRANKSRKGDSDFWLNISEADYQFLTLSDPESVGYAYSRVAPELQAFHKESIRRQLELFRALGVLTENAQAALEAVPAESGADRGLSPVPTKIDHVIVFTGHRIDNKDRQSPRFPAKCETAARDEIRRTVQSLRELSKEKVVGVAGAASGGDILFHEVCRELNIVSRIFLCLPPDVYIAASVAPADADWEKRFYEIGAAATDVPILAESKEMPRWLKGKKDYDIWQRNNLWELSQASALGAEHMTLIALWDGKKGDGPGGTEHMVKIAREWNANIRILDTNQIFQKI